MKMKPITNEAYSISIKIFYIINMRGIRLYNLKEICSTYTYYYYIALTNATG